MPQSDEREAIARIYHAATRKLGFILLPTLIANFDDLALQIEVAALNQAAGRRDAARRRDEEPDGTPSPSGTFTVDGEDGYPVE